MNSTLRLAARLSPGGSMRRPAKITYRPARGRRKLGLAALILGFAGMFAAEPALADYVVQKLVSDLPGVAPHLDPNLVNPWGLTRSPTSPWWVSDNGTGVSTLYDGSGAPRPLVVTIPRLRTTQRGPRLPERCSTEQPVSAAPASSSRPRTGR